MNKVFLKGNLTRDPDIREIPLGSKTSTVANFTLAVSRHFKKQNGDTEQVTEFLDCEAWDTGAVTIGKILHKGDPVLIEGSLKKETWEDKETGAKRSRVKIRISTFDKLGRYTSPDKPAEQTAKEVEETLPTPELQAVATNGDDIPF